MSESKGVMEMARDLMKLEQEKELIAIKLKDKNKEITALENGILSLMEAQGMKDFSSPFAKFSRKSQPYATIKDQDVLINYLKEIGSYENLVTLSATTANKWYGEQLDRAKEEGNIDFSVPGMEMTSSRITLSITQKKPHLLD